MEVSRREIIQGVAATAMLPMIPNMVKLPKQNDPTIVDMISIDDFIHKQAGNFYYTNNNKFVLLSFKNTKDINVPNGVRYVWEHQLWSCKMKDRASCEFLINRIRGFPKNLQTDLLGDLNKEVPDGTFIGKVGLRISGEKERYWPYPYIINLYPYEFTLGVRCYYTEEICLRE